MTEPTLTRQALRRTIARELRMEFAMRYNDVSALTAVGSTTSVTDSKLTQPTDFWKNSYLFLVDGNAALDVRRITASTSGGALTLEYALSALPTIADHYEIHSIHSANSIHAALNRAIREGFPSFFDVVTDESLILNEYQLEYDLTALTSLPHRIKKVFRETNGNSVTRGTATSGGATTLVDTHLIGQLGAVTTNYKLSIYAGTGKGQQRQVVSVTDATGTITVAAWTTNPDSTSKYSLWDPTIQRREWDHVLAARFDNKAWPSKLYLYKVPTFEWGLRIRLQYTARCAQLAAETDTTITPEAYLVDKALAILFKTMVNDNRADRQRYAALTDEHEKAAMDFMQRRAFVEPDGTLWQDYEEGAQYLNTMNPLGWK